MIYRFLFRVAAAISILPLIGSCDKELPEGGGSTVPEGMVEVCPVLPGMFGAIPREASEVRSAATRTYDDHATTNGKLTDPVQLPDGSTVWLIAENTKTGKYEKNSYVVYSSGGEEARTSFLYPCKVDAKGDVISQEGTPLYLKAGETYLFYAVSPARQLDESKFAQGTVGFQIKNGEAFYANDCRYPNTFPSTPITIGEGDGSDSEEAVQMIELKPMINQTAQLKFRIKEGTGVHDLDIQPSGIQISGLQNDAPAAGIYGDPAGLYWHMSQSENDEPILLQHGDKTGTYNSYDYSIDAERRVNIEVPVLPMRNLSKPIIVLLRLKVNGVPSTYEMMLNEKDFKAGYSYGYRGLVSIEEGVTVITWQFVSWDIDVEFPFE